MSPLNPPQNTNQVPPEFVYLRSRHSAHAHGHSQITDYKDENGSKIVLVFKEKVVLDLTNLPDEKNEVSGEEEQKSKWKFRKKAEKRPGEELHESIQSRRKVRKSEFNPPANDPQNKQVINKANIVSTDRDRPNVNYVEKDEDSMDIVMVEPGYIELGSLAGHRPAPVFVLEPISDEDDLETLIINKLRKQIGGQ